MNLRTTRHLDARAASVSLCTETSRYGSYLVRISVLRFNNLEKEGKDVGES